MALNHRKSWLAGWLLVFLTAAPAWSQGLEDAQLFAPAEMDQFGGGPRPNEGFFISIDYLRWTIEAPDKTTIGKEGLTREVTYDSGDPLLDAPAHVAIQSNTHDNGFLKADWTDGQRIEFGDVAGHHGWIFSTFRLHDQDQRDTFSAMTMTVQDLETLPHNRKLQGLVYHWAGWDSSNPVYSNITDQLYDLPLTFDTVNVENRVELWGLEWMYLYRLHPNHHGGIFELFMGARYLEFDEQFNVDARGERFTYDGGGAVTGPRSVLADSYWNTDAENHVVGPQIGARYFKTSNRWTFSTEGRFLAGFNSQNIRQRGTLGTQLNEPWGNSTDGAVDYQWTAPHNGDPYVPISTTTTSFNHSEHEKEFSPAIEVRLEAKYQITRAISAKFGWDLFWVDGIARSSDMVDYTLSDTQVFGINKANNRQDVLMQGWNIGIELNR